MTAPTVWGFTGVAGTTKTFPIEGTNLFGVDLAGTLTPQVFTIGPNMNLVLTATVADADLSAAMLTFAKRLGLQHDGAGGYTAQGTVQKSPALTTTS